MQIKADNSISHPDKNPDQKPDRILGVWDLIFYGIVLNQPVGAVGLFGLVSVISRGHMVTTLLLSMLAMSITALSYGRMAGLYPSAGSAYTYVGRGINQHAGFMAGWIMVLCYLIIPVINTVFGVLTLQRLFPWIPFTPGAIGFIILITALNLLGIRSSMRANKIMLYLMLIIITAFVVLAVKYIISTLGYEGLLDTKPIFNPETFGIKEVASGMSLVALTYVGFDGITTLAEDVKNPKRNILTAIVAVCIFTGLFSGLQMYLAQQSAQTMWIDNLNSTLTHFYQRIPKENIETAFMTVCLQVGKPLLFNAFIVTMFVACVGSGLAGQLGAAKLLYGMGKEDVLPRNFFARLDKKNTPVYNIVFIGLLSVIGALFLNYQKVAELINFAALLAFMGVNMAAVWRLFFRSDKNQRNTLTDLILPSVGFLFCLWIWFSLPSGSKIMGGIWCLAGLIYLVLSTKGFRKKPVTLDFSDT